MLQKNLTRKQREFMRHREEIMLTALSLFSEKGFNNVSMQEIAVRSEFAVGTLYKFFSTKEELYSEVLKEKVMEFHSHLIKSLKTSGSEIKRLRMFLEKKLQWFKENMDFVRLFVTETFGVGFIDKTELDQINERVHKELLNEIGNLFKSGIQKKIFKRMDPHFLAVSLNGLSNGILFELIENKDFGLFDSEIVLKLFLQSICFEEVENIM
ncbi:MAG: TetR/AcrR family transcriptional regulator [Desulfobacterales bacterium]